MSSHDKTSHDDLSGARYVSFTTFRRDGSPVSTPVWVVPFEGGWAFTTGGEAGKVKRLRNDARATLQVCDRRGRVADGTTVHEGAAIILHGDDYERVAALVRDKYKVGWALLSVWERAQKLLGRDDGIADRAIKVTLHA
ncbi:MAG: PPOX class F420-dependent oxidoreductase [Ilumatobacteraceae bacterium]